MKKSLRRGVHSSKPENNSEIFFNYEIYDLKNGTKIYTSSEKEIDLEDQIWKDIDTFRDSGLSYKCFLDEYRISKLLKNCLKMSKKMEICEISIFNPTRYLQYGDDYNEVIKYNKNIDQLQLKYIIKLYNFTEVNVYLNSCHILIG